MTNCLIRLITITLVLGGCCGRVSDRTSFSIVIKETSKMYTYFIHGALILFVVGSVLCKPIWNSYNDHYYDIISLNTTWTEACSYSYQHESRSGYLATITSQSEMNFVSANLQGNDVWLAAKEYNGTETKNIKAISKSLHCNHCY